MKLSNYTELVKSIDEADTQIGVIDALKSAQRDDLTKIADRLYYLHKLVDENPSEEHDPYYDDPPVNLESIRFFAKFVVDMIMMFPLSNTTYRICLTCEDGFVSAELNYKEAIISLDFQEDGLITFAALSNIDERQTFHGTTDVHFVNIIIAPFVFKTFANHKYDVKPVDPSPEKASWYAEIMKPMTTKEEMLGFFRRLPGPCTVELKALSKAAYNRSLMSSKKTI